MNDEVLQGMLRRIHELEREVARLKQREQVAMRSVSDTGGYPAAGIVGQVLVDFDGGHLRYWNGSAWVAFT